ncbi:SIS domain-containing protein [Actinoplanes sp. NPDC026619]|uniref:D-sedoheptulose-7-phosphate isomerase n=1 Tax=Actinoplanes sp. NPDC026619 TaxID=3155798 RepID=UPI0033D800FC
MSGQDRVPRAEDATEPERLAHLNGTVHVPRTRGDEDLEHRTEAYLDDLRDGLGNIGVADVTAALRRLDGLMRRGGTGYIMGNGGSASTAAHFVNDLTRAALLGGRSSLRVFCLSDNVSTVTAVANDYGYEHIFTGQLRNLLAGSDLVIGISARGNSPNVVDAVRFARSRGVDTLAFVGFDGGVLRRLADHVVHVPVHDVRQVEDLHLAVCHIISALLVEA